MLEMFENIAKFWQKSTIQTSLILLNSLLYHTYHRMNASMNVYVICMH